MRLVLCAIGLLLLSLAPLLPQQVKVLSPNGGETLVLGQDSTILWSRSEPGKTFKITLYRNGALVGVIYKNAVTDPAGKGNIL